MNDTLKKILKFAGVTSIAAAVAGGTAFAISSYMLKIALDRKEPEPARRLQERMKAKKADQDFLKLRYETADKLEATPHEKIEIVAEDGTNLTGHWFQVKRAKRVIIAMHGWRSTWAKDFGMVSEFLKAQGCSVLYVEQRGQNASGGEYMGFGTKERFDCVSWIKWVQGRVGKKTPIYLLGVSMGAATVLMASGLELPKQVHGIMADCGFTSPEAIFKAVTNRGLHLPYAPFDEIVDRLYKAKMDEEPDEITAPKALEKNDIPVLFAHGTDDGFVPVEMTYENYQACKAEKRLLIVPGADHGMSYYVETAKYQRTLIEFWNDFDDPKYSARYGVIGTL